MSKTITYALYPKLRKRKVTKTYEQGFGQNGGVSSLGTTYEDLDSDGVPDTIVKNSPRTGAFKRAVGVVRRSYLGSAGLVVLAPPVPPVITSNGGLAAAAITVAENQTAVTTVTATGSGLTWSITGGVDNALFDLNATTGVLTFKVAPDFEVPTDTIPFNIYRVVVTATNSGGTDTQDISVTVTDVEETPVIITNLGGATAAINVAENATHVTAAEARGHTASADTMTWSITGGADQALFSITDSGNSPTLGILTFINAPDFETPGDADAGNDYDVEITATNSAGSDIQTITVTVTDVVELSQINPALVAIAATIFADTTQITGTFAFGTDTQNFYIWNGASWLIFTP